MKKKEDEKMEVDAGDEVVEEVEAGAEYGQEDDEEDAEAVTQPKQKPGNKNGKSAKEGTQGPQQDEKLVDVCEFEEPRGMFCQTCRYVHGLTGTREDGQVAMGSHCEKAGKS